MYLEQLEWKLRMRMNDVFIYLNKKCSQKQSSEPHLKLKIIIWILIVIRKVGMRILFLEVTAMSLLNF